MAKSIVTTNGTAYIPGAYSSYRVLSNPGGLATTGVLFLIGEADAGPAWTVESDIETNSYGPDQLADVVNKYRSGPLVDAMRGAVSAANDPDITGSFNRAFLLKTNAGAKASGNLVNVAAGTYATIADKSWGKLGNQIQVSVVQAQAETVPQFSFVPTATSGVTLGVRVNGGAAVTQAITQFVQGSADGTLPSTIGALTGLAGGVSRGMLTTTTGTLAAAWTSGSTVTFTRSVAWDVIPTVGDSLLVSSGGTWATTATTGANAVNVSGWYIITAATSTTVTATKVVGSTPTGSIAAATFTAGALVAYSPVTAAATLIDGFGKSLEVYASAGVPAATMCYTASAVAIPLSTSGAPSLITSATEQRVTLNASRSSDLISESWTAGGELPFQIGYTGTTATMSITATTLTTTVTGGSGTSLSLNLADYPTIQSLCDYISTQTGYSAAPGTAAMGLQPPAALDDVTNVGICRQFGTVLPGRVKWDAYLLNKAIGAGSVLVQLGTVANTTTAAAAGLPQPQNAFFLSGGTRGATTDALVTSALAACETLSGNFVVPLFSRDATSDIADGLTDSTSTYTIAGINAAVKSHVLAMAQYKRRKNRQGLVSMQAPFLTQRNAAANLATFRLNMAFQNIKTSNSSGVLSTFQPWMGAIKAASMQAAGFYRSIENKGIDISGVTHAAGDFDPRSDSNVEDALTSGLMPIRRRPTGGYYWVSDQTTYGKDDNFVFNSLQATYAADTVSLTVAQRMEQAFVGQSVADINKNVAQAYLESILDDMRRLKLIAGSDDAPAGYKNASIRISANALFVSVEIKLATAIDFVNIDFLVAPVQQSS